MTDWDQISDRFCNALRALDVERVQAEAERRVQLALIGAPGSGKTTVASALAERPTGETGTFEWTQYLPEYQLPLAAHEVSGLDTAELLILLLDATKGDYAAEVAAAEYLSYLGKPVLVCYSKMDLVPTETRLIRGQARWRGSEIMPVCAVHPETVKEQLGPAILDVLPEHALPLARHLPLFRSLVADRWIEQSALANAAHASATGLAENVPLLRMPLHAGDVEGLGLSLAGMAYKLGVAYGLPLDWQQSAEASALTLSSGQWWQQLSRHVLGLIPLWGLDSKVALVYGGTVVSGRAVQAWCDTGHMLSPKQLHEVCHEAASQARRTSRGLVEKAREALPPTPIKHERPARGKLRLPQLPKARPRPVCAACGRTNQRDAAFCAYCGASLARTDSGVKDEAARPQGGPSAGPDRK
jgi:hypothetical protein